MTGPRIALLVVWLLLAAVPLAWWLRNRTRVDVWKALPVPAVMLDRGGQVRERSHSSQPAPARPRRLRRRKPHSADHGGDQRRAEEAAAARSGAAPGQATAETALDLRPTTPLPPRGQTVRAQAADGTPLALTGTARGALVVALPANPVAERRDKLLADLGSRLAHDINTPLAALTGHLDLIAHEKISERAAESVDICQRELQRLSTTAGDLLTFTRLRASSTPRSEHLAGVLVEDAAIAFVDRAEEEDVDLSVQVPNELVFVTAAEADLVRALRNLVTNAFTHGLSERREINVSATADDATVVFAVADRGPGLDPAALNELLQPMARGRNVTATGSGLGLAIVGEVLQGHGTQLAAARRPGGGAVLSFTLPRVR